MSNIVFIATSLDGYIADKNNSIDWLHSIPDTDTLDTGYLALMDKVDALVMGRKTMEKVMELVNEWPYTKHVFLLSNTLNSVPKELEGKVTLVQGELQQLTSKLNRDGYEHLYIDGGKTIQNFLKFDGIDEMIITTIPVVLGGGTSLFGELAEPLEFRCVKSDHFANGVCQNHFIRHR